MPFVSQRFRVQISTGTGETLFRFWVCSRMLQEKFWWELNVMFMAVKKKLCKLGANIVHDNKRYKVDFRVFGSITRDYFLVNLLVHVAPSTENRLKYLTYGLFLILF